MNTNEKYVVFKMEDWERFENSLDNPGMLHVLGNKALDECVVIRYQDVFAASALHAYADTVLTAAEVMDATGGDTKQSQELRRLADRFKSFAEEAHGVFLRKLPD